MLNSPGTVDSDYRGEVGVILHNASDTPYEIEVGERVAQAVIAAVPAVEYIAVTSLDVTVRGDGGFGSTGKS